MYLKKKFLLLFNECIEVLISLNKFKLNMPRKINKKDKIITTYLKIPKINEINNICDIKIDDIERLKKR